MSDNKRSAFEAWWNGDVASERTKLTAWAAFQAGWNAGHAHALEEIGAGGVGDVAPVRVQTQQAPEHDTEDEYRWPNAVTEPPQAEEFEDVYQTIVQWDEGGGKRSRRELARRIVRLHAYQAALPSRPVQGGEQSGNWEGAEEWMPLAWELCANECGEDACTELIWEGGPIPEPWGDRWLKYEGQAKEMIAMVRKHVPAPSSAPAREPMSYRELTASDIIEPEDEFLQCDCISWEIDPAGTFVGIRYQPGSALRVARRPLHGICKE